MKVLLRKCFAIAAMFGFGYLLLEVFQYRNAATALGTLTHVGEKICLYYGDEFSHFGCDSTAVKLTYKDGEIDREVDLKYLNPTSRPGSYRSAVPRPVVGVQTTVVYVPGRPWERVWITAFLALFAWIAWRGNEHPLLVWLNARRGWPNKS
jgi:hypothetical protein